MQAAVEIYNEQTGKKKNVTAEEETKVEQQKAASKLKSKTSLPFPRAKTMPQRPPSGKFKAEKKTKADSYINESEVVAETDLNEKFNAAVIQSSRKQFNIEEEDKRAVEIPFKKQVLDLAPIMAQTQQHQNQPVDLIKNSSRTNE